MTRRLSRIWFILSIGMLIVTFVEKGSTQVFTLKDIEQRHKVSFTDDAKNTIRDADPVAIDSYVKQVKAVYPDKISITPLDFKDFRNDFREYGRLRLSSNPDKAEVFLGNTSEGKTPLLRVYPVRSYRFKITKVGCTSQEIGVDIKSDTEISKNVALECK